MDPVTTHLVTGTPKMANLIDFKSVIGHIFVPVYYIERSIGRCVSRTSEEKPSYLD